MSRRDHFSYTRPQIEALLPAVWVAAPGTGGRYEVSRDGRVRNASTGRILRAAPLQSGHRRFTMTRPGLPDKTLKVHRLVCEAFNGPAPFEGALVRHLDGDPGHNAAENLAWGTFADNSEDSRRHQTMYAGERTHLAKLRTADVVELRRRYDAGERISEISTATGVAQSTVFNIVKRKTWRCVA